ncbi:hypothetical protein [Nocardia sp. NBC_01327]|uniref:hypothetical protein n=1 Tax=Nocardia sp. NBC_01327 TaxID=2903593 RepID=UPI002E1561D8|nr:hypothetical protein OG326_23760 [Nocardia sp. NBC_01327]
MPRTAEQISADDALTEAIDRHHRAYHPGDIEGVLTKYVVVAQRQWWDDDGDQMTAHLTTPRDEGLPLSDALGLLEFAATRIRRDISEDD